MFEQHDGLFYPAAAASFGQMCDPVRSGRQPLKQFTRECARPVIEVSSAAQARPMQRARRGRTLDPRIRRNVLDRTTHSST
jgi:hypothetical protein